MGIFGIIQLIVAVLLIGAILLQNRGTGLGAAFGGEGNVYRTKRGLEKSLFRATVVIAVLFFGFALVTTLRQPSGADTIAPQTSSVPRDLTNTTAPAADASPDAAADSSPIPAPTP